MTTHAILSPSSATRWMTCHGSVELTRDVPDTAGADANWGTAGHELTAWILDGAFDSGSVLEPIADYDILPASNWLDEKMSNDVRVNEDMVTAVDSCIALFKARIAEYQLAGATVTAHVEVGVPIDHLTGEDQAQGTADIILVVEYPDGTTLLEVIDWKFGRGVEVSAVGNPQLRIYALGTIEFLGPLVDVQRVRMTIHQPRLSGAPSEEEIGIDDLNAFAGQVAGAAKRCQEASNLVRVVSAEMWAGNYLQPSKSACKFCRAKATCPALQATVERAIGAEITDLTAVAAEGATTSIDSDDALADKMAAADLVEIWLKAVRAETERRLLAGTPVPGWKLVQGRAGARKWIDETQAEATLKSMRLKHDEMYDYSVISPTTAEKLHKADKLGDRQWKKLQDLIGRSEGKPSVAPESDKRPALVIAPVDVQAEAADLTTADDLL